MFWPTSLRTLRDEARTLLLRFAEDRYYIGVKPRVRSQRRRSDVFSTHQQPPLSTLARLFFGGGMHCEHGTMRL